MDTRKPHDIRDFEAIPEGERKHHVPIPLDMEERLRAMSPDERAAWQEARLSRTLSPKNRAETTRIAQRICDSLQAAVSPVIDSMDELAPDENNVPLLLGVLIGCRAWLGQFKALEDRLLSPLETAGLPRERYERMKLQADAAGIMCIQLVQTLVDNDQGD